LLPDQYYLSLVGKLESPLPNLTTTEKCQLIERMSHFIPHASLQGIRLEQIDGEEITLRLPYRAALVGNPETGAMHSGVITVLLAHTLGMAGICCDRVGAVLTPTLDLRIDHLGIAPAGRDILATARVYRVTRRILFVEGFAYCESGTGQSPGPPDRQCQYQRLARAQR
jgi:uncharacterized protein (TIGR00369 family)